MRVLATPDADGVAVRRAGCGDEHWGWAELPARFAEVEAARPRWVWADTTQLYPHLLGMGVRAEQCHDLRMVHRLLAASARCQFDADPVWAPRPLVPDDGVPSLLDLPGSGAGPPLEALDAEYARQRDAIESSATPGRLRLLAAAESAGALVAAELTWFGLPWDAHVHDALLTAALGPRTGFGRPARLEALAVEIRTLLGQPRLNPDSPPDVLRGLQSAGLAVRSTRKWELREIDHPVIAPLLEYKRLARLLAANGWAWMDTWVHGGRFHPDYVPGGVVTGRWATRGGGALQLPREIRGAVVAEPGHRLVVADAAQLEPRVLAAMSGDRAMAEAGRGLDLYQGLVERGVVDSRTDAKLGMLGALYGGTQGASGVVMPRLMRAYPRATGFVEDAARTGERGGIVTTHLGRSSPPPPDPAAAGREWGRFTRNFVVQGTAAEWALCWIAGIRNALHAQGAGARLCYFLHDEVIVHAPTEVADEVARIVGHQASAAGRLLFGDTPVEFPLSVAVVDDYGQAKP